MARAELTPQQVTVAGLNPSFAAAVEDGDVFDPGAVLLWVENASASPVTVTVPTPLTVGGLAVAEAGGSVPAGEFRLFGPFPRSVFGQAVGETDEGKVYVDYSDVTSVTRALIKL
jgi:hypothetical protein